RKAIVLLALTTSVSATELAPLVRAAVGRAPCTDQIWLCRTHCPPKRTGASSCHGEEDRATQMKAVCHHGEDSAPAPVPPRVLPTTASLLPPWRSGSLSPPSSSRVDLGFLRHELPPPRELA